MLRDSQQLLILLARRPVNLTQSSKPTKDLPNKSRGPQSLKQKFIEEELNSNDQDFEDHASVQTNAEDLNGFSDAELEAQNLEKSLNEVNKHQ
jgi:hypothetical protein